MTQRSITYLKARFESGDIPNGTDYSDLMDSFLSLESSAAQTMNGTLNVPDVVASSITLSGQLIRSYTNANATGVSQSTGVHVSADVSYIYVQSSANRAVRLNDFRLGKTYYITNASNSVTAATIYPASGVNFIGTAANAPILLAAAKTMLAIPVDSSVLAVGRF